MLLSILRGLMLVVFVTGSWSAAPTPKAAPTGEQPQAHGLPEVRLRKLHIVRPDLIPYPIAIEVYC